MLVKSGQNNNFESSHISTTILGLSYSTTALTIYNLLLYPSSGSELPIFFARVFPPNPVGVDFPIGVTPRLHDVLEDGLCPNDVPGEVPPSTAPRLRSSVLDTPFVDTPFVSVDELHGVFQDVVEQCARGSLSLSTPSQDRSTNSGRLSF